MASVRPFPQDALHHEKYSISKFLREFDECPEEVRVTYVEGSFFRPSLFIRVSGVGIEDESLRHFYTRRTGVAMYYGETSKDGDKFLEADRMSEFLVNALIRGHDGLERGCIRIYDFSDPASEVFTDHWIEIDATSVDAQPIQDDYEHWMIPVDFRYMVERGDGITAPIVTDVDITYDY